MMRRLARSTLLLLAGSASLLDGQGAPGSTRAESRAGGRSAGAGSAGATAVAAIPSAPPKPTLVVFLTIDQLGSDYLARFGGNLTGGLKRLRDDGATWLYGAHDHAITETAPGHAATMSGRFPVHTGIASNSQGVNTREAPLIDADDTGASPFRFKGTVLLDWMLAADPTTRSLSVSRKDRGAILPFGTVKTHVYWFASNGRFTTSRYYRDTLPTWVARFNARNIPQRYAGQEWTPLLPADRYAEPDSVSFEADGDYTFPHRLSRDSARAARDIRDWPWMDSLTLAFALEGTRTLGLGSAANRTDLLAISLSTTDAVGHRYGPDSKEIHDQILRLDRYLGQFLDSLLALRGRDRVVIALTADHGVQPIPELRSAWYPNHDAQRVDPAPAWRTVRAALRRAGVDSNAVDSDDGFRVVDPEAFRRANVDPDAIARLWVAELRKMNGVASADLIADLARADTTTNVVARRWLHQFAPDGPIRAVVSLEPFAYWKSTTYATHGSPNEADARVPVLFWGAGIAAGRRAGEARVVDMAPTLAQWLRIRPLERLDGVPLTLTP